MTFKVGRESHVQITNLKDPAKEAELKRFDTKLNDGVLDAEESADYFASVSGGGQPLNMSEVYAKAGGRQHDIKLLSNNYWSTIGGSGANHWAGDFHVSGLGAGNVGTGRLIAPGNVDAFAFNINADLIDKKFLDEKIESASVFVGPKGFRPEDGSSLGEQIEIPLNIATKDAETVQTYSRGGGGGSYTIPEKKMLGARVDVDSLRALAGDSGGLSFYVRVNTTDGKTVWINKDGVPGRNFEIDANELKARGP